MVLFVGEVRGGVGFCGCVCAFRWYFWRGGEFFAGRMLRGRLGVHGVGELWRGAFQEVSRVGRVLHEENAS